jgi:hypothetical protein
MQVQVRSGSAEKSWIEGVIVYLMDGWMRAQRIRTRSDGATKTVVVVQLVRLEQWDSSDAEQSGRRATYLEQSNGRTQTWTRKRRRTAARGMTMYVQGKLTQLGSG